MFRAASIAPLVLTGAAWIDGIAAQQPTSVGPEAQADIVVRAIRPDIVVNGRLPRCARRPDDPLDRVDVARVPRGRQMMIARASPDQPFALARDTDPIGGADWQRAGTALQDYTFRAPDDGTPLCIGSRTPSPGGFAQLRRIVDATEFRGRGVRFSGYIATNRRGAVRLWLAVGIEKRGVIAGNATPTALLNKRAGWKPFALEVPFVPGKAWSISYGFLLDGPGDVWVHQPTLEMLSSGARSGGSAQLRSIRRQHTIRSDQLRSRSLAVFTAA